MEKLVVPILIDSTNKLNDSIPACMKSGNEPDRQKLIFRHHDIKNRAANNLKFEQHKLEVFTNLVRNISFFIPEGQPRIDEFNYMVEAANNMAEEENKARLLLDLPMVIPQLPAGQAQNDAMNAIKNAVSNMIDKKWERTLSMSLSTCIPDLQTN